MGQIVEIRNTVTMGDLLMIDTDRSFTGQDGHVIARGDDGEGVPGVLARRLFGLDLGIDHIYVLQNTVTVRRPGGWDEEASHAVSDATHKFLLYYEDEKSDEGAPLETETEESSEEE